MRLYSSFLHFLCFWHCSLGAKAQDTEWKKVYSLTNPQDAGYFGDLMEAEHKNAENESADLFSILYQLEQFRNCDGVFHFKLCYPDLVGNFNFPCNEWTQSSNPLYESLIEDFTPIKIT